MNLKINIWLVGAAILLLNSFIAAQSAIIRDDDDVQSWNDVQVAVPLSKQFDFVTGFSARFGKKVSRLEEGRFLIGYTWKPEKSLTVSPFYMQIKARNTLGQFKVEHRLHLRATYKFPIKSFGLSHRSQFEYRMRSPRNTWRYRPSLTFEKEILKNFIPGAKFYLTEEPFYESATSKFSRNRFSVGVVRTLSGTTSLDIYYLRQDVGSSSLGDFNVIGTSLRIKL